jgi:hypothetical protein
MSYRWELHVCPAVSIIKTLKRMSYRWELHVFHRNCIRSVVEEVAYRTLHVIDDE